MAKGSNHTYKAKKITTGPNAGKWRIYDETLGRWIQSTKLYSTRTTARIAIANLKRSGRS